MADLIPPVPDDPSFNFILKNWLFKMRRNVNLFADQIYSILHIPQLSDLSPNLGSITTGEISIGSSPARSGTTMTGSGAHIYPDGKFSIGKAAQNLTYDGSDLYLNGFYANNNSSYSTSIIYSGAAVNFTAKDFNGVGEFPSGTLQKSSVFCTFNGQLGVKINTATQRMLRIDASLTIEKWDGSSWVSPQTVASLNDTRITGTDTAVAYPFTITIAKPFNIGSFSAGSLYRMYIRAQVTCYSLAGALAAEMTQVYLDGETNFVELKI